MKNKVTASDKVLLAAYKLLNKKKIFSAEDLTVKSEDLKVTYMQGRKFRKTAILPKSLKGGKI